MSYRTPGENGKPFRLPWRKRAVEWIKGRNVAGPIVMTGVVMIAVLLVTMVINEIWDNSRMYEWCNSVCYPLQVRVCQPDMVVCHGRDTIIERDAGPEGGGQ
jgi:hypothetical protein